MRYTYIPWKNVRLADCLLQIEKVVLLTNSQEYDLATAKLTSTSYEMLKRMGKDRNWQDIKKKMEEVYSPIGTEVLVASDLHGKQRPDKTLQECKQNFTDSTTKGHGC